MKKYEIMYIVNAGLDEEARKAEIEKLHTILTTNGASVTKVNEWGLRDFAYPIDDMVRGYCYQSNSRRSGLKRIRSFSKNR